MVKKYLQIACQKIISGGQTGVDRAALDTCLELNFPCGGWCPKGRRSEDGVIDKRYPLKEAQDSSYDLRTMLNVNGSDGTLIISHAKLRGGTLLTYNLALERNKPVLVVTSDYDALLAGITEWVKEQQIFILNVAGPRESEWPQGYRIAYNLIKRLILSIKKQV